MNHSRKLSWLPKNSESSLLTEYMNFLNIDHIKRLKVMSSYTVGHWNTQKVFGHLLLSLLALISKNLQQKF